MNTKEVKLMIIENFIDYYVHTEDKREQIKMDATLYVAEDHVDEITQAGYIKPDKALCREIEDKVLKAWEGRRMAQGYKKTSKKTLDLQYEFLLGMVAALDVLTNAEETGESSISPKIMFSIMRGDYIE